MIVFQGFGIKAVNFASMTLAYGHTCQLHP